MKVAIDISPIDRKSLSAHKVRGVGRYIKVLTDNLEKFDKKNQYIFISNTDSLKGKIDLLHFPYFDPFFVNLPINKKYKTVVTVHDLIPITHSKHFPRGIKGNLKWQANKFLLKKVDGIITDSVASKNSVIKNLAISPEKIYPVLLAIDEIYKKIEVSVNQKKELQKKYNLPEKFFLYVGDVTWNKNLPRLVKAVKEVGLPLVMVGKALTSDYDPKNAWNNDRLVIEKETNSDLFIRAGFIEDNDLVKIYNIATALLMPSLDEGFGLPVLEGMSCGCPVLTTNEGSLPEVGGDAVLYVDANSTDSLVDGLKKIQDNNLRKSLIDKGLVQSKIFTVEKFIKDTINCYNLVNV